MKERLKNGNALLAVSIIGLLALAVLLYTGNEFARQSQNARMATADYSILALAVVVGVAWLATLIIGEYDVLASKNKTEWKVVWGLAILVLSFAGAVLYCLFGRKS